MDDPLKTDLGMVVDEKGIADLVWSGGDIPTVTGKENLCQALALRLVSSRGELGALGHARYGSLVKDLIGEPLDRANLELLRRYVRQAIKEEPRVEETLRVVVQPRAGEPGVVSVDVTVRAVTGEEVTLELALDLG
jgi:phage baseplate assembly protein W